MIFYCISLLFILASITQLGFLFLLKFRKSFFIKPTSSAPSIPVSIIICAKNESKNLQRFLPFVLEQDYPQHLFEVIVVNDQSTDHSESILAHFEKTYSNLKILTISTDEVKTLPGKKYALSKGIAAASYETLLLTDADCKPASKQWLKIISKSQASIPQIILGYGAYKTQRGLLNKFIRWETANTSMQYTSYAAVGVPYMGVGRNLSYNKSLLDPLTSDTAFQSIYKNTPSGDDDLLIAKIATKENTMVCLNKEAHTISVPQSTWKNWWKQKTRHGSTGKYYPQKVKTRLGLYALSHSLYWFLGLPLLICGLTNGNLKTGIETLEYKNWILILVISLFLLRLFLYWLNASKWYRNLDEKKILLFYPLGDLGWAIYNVLLSPYIFWKNKQTWK